MTHAAVIKPQKNSHFNLVDATRSQVLQFIEEQREDGKMVCVTSQLTNRCVNSGIVPKERGILSLPSQWHGFNFMELWRESMGDFSLLQNGLRDDGYIPNFTYDLLRVDGSKCRFEKDYYLARNYFGNDIEPVRISVGEFDNFEIIRPTLS